MKKLIPALFLLLLFSSCKKYRLVHFGCDDSVGGPNGFFPNIFTPNADGNNDLFQLYRSDSTLLSNFHIVIKNTFGVKVFESSDPDFAWNGRNSKGCDLKDDIYKVSVTATILSNPPSDFSSKGTITMFRDKFKKFCPKHFDACQYGSQWDGAHYNATLPTNEFFSYQCD